MTGSTVAALRLVIWLATLWPTCGLGAAYDPVMRTLPLTHHVSLDEVLDSGLRPRQLSRDSFQDFRVAIGSVRLDRVDTARPPDSGRRLAAGQKAGAFLTVRTGA